jgi:hypothetical protein
LGHKASTFQKEDNIMKWVSMLVRTLGVGTLVGLASLALPVPAQAGGVQVSIGVGLPVVVAPAPVMVQPAPMVVPQAVLVQRAPVIVTESPVVVAEPRGVYGYPYYRGYYRHWKHHPHRD